MENIVQGQWFRGPSADLGDEISQSLLFSNNGAAATKYLTNSSINWLGDQTYTISYWLKKAFSNSSSMWIDPFNNDTSAGGTPGAAVHHTGSGGLSMYSGSSFARGYTGSPVFRDPNAWYHFVHSRNASGWQTWVNGVSLGTAAIADSDGAGGTKIMNPWGGGQSQSSAYLAEYHIVDGQYLQPTSFGRYNEDQVWVPKTYADNGSTSHGTNGFHLTFDSSQSNGVGHDSSGNGNHFTATGFDTTAISSANRLNDIDIKDTPTSNYTTFNPLWHQQTPSLKEGNMALNTANTITGQATFRFPVGTTGKYWVEAGTANLGATTNAPALCITDQLNAVGLSNTAWSTTANYSSIGGYQASYSNFTSTSATSYTTVGGQVGMAIDFDNEEVKMYNNSSLINTDTTVDFTKELAIVVMQPTTSYNTYDPYLNAGQQAFIQTVPTGFKELQTNNLTEPTIKKGNKHFGVLTYSAPGSPSYPITINGSGGNNGTGELDFGGQPDLVWIKMTNGTQNNILFDSLRGASKSLRPSDSIAESNRTNFAFATNGFTISATDGETYQQNDSYVAWCWKAGTSYTPTVTGYTSPSASINTEAGFGIYKFTGNNTASSFTHGLSKRPQLVIAKNLGSENWAVFGPTTTSTALAATATFHRLDLDDYVTKGGNVLTAVSDTTLSFGSYSEVAGSADYIFYCWHSVEGYSKIGNYYGTGSANGAFEYCGFRPAFIMIKCINQDGNWNIYDSTRNPANPINDVLRWNIDNQVEQPSGENIDILSNGFKCRGLNRNINETYHYMYMAFAENPFGGANTPPVTAR